MRNVFLAMFMLASNVVFGQRSFFEMLPGIWKMKNKENYEQWSRADGNNLKGIGYKLKNGLPEISEYLDLSEEGNGIYLTAIVPNQNSGKGIRFKLKAEGEKYVFENSLHDFPQKIVYEFINEDNIQISLSGKEERVISYVLERLTQSGITEATANTAYDAALAHRLGADDYGMKNYWLVILKTGTNTTTDKNYVSKKFNGHMTNMGKMVEDGKLVVAGPIMKNDRSYRGIFIINNVNSEEEIKALLKTDPAIEAGLLDVEIFKWYGSAALPEYLKPADKIWKSKP